MERQEAFGFPSFAVPATPPGLEAIYKACRRIYPDQPNPLQVTALVKYWLGGPDPLDYISMYGHPGQPEKNIPPHWHYVSFGLSDLHGDGRVHQCAGPDGLSGFGFELTFRLRREDNETAPPTWPATLMQALARYVFQSENTLCAGDHVPWHTSLDSSESRVQHMLMTEDIQLPTISTSHGSVGFVQIVGVCAEELKAAQHWTGTGVIDLLRSNPLAGGQWLITDMRRGETILELDPQVQETIDAGIDREGSNLSGVSGRCSWEEYKHFLEENKENRRSDRSSRDGPRRRISDFESEQIKATLKKGLLGSQKSLLPPIKPEPNERDSECQGNMCQNNWGRDSLESSMRSETPTELLRTRYLEGCHLKFNLEAGSLILLALKGRLKHGRHFTFKSLLNDIAITFVSTSVVGSFATEEHPFAAHGAWLQVLLTEDFVEDLVYDLSDLSEVDEITNVRDYKWPERGLKISILPDDIS